MRTHLLALMLLCALAALTPARRAHAAEVNILVFMEHGIGNAAQAKPHLKKLVDLAAQQNGWSSAEGNYVTERGQAKKYIERTKPQFGILSLGAFLAMRKPSKLAVVGAAEVDRAGGRQYFLVRKGGGKLGDCLHKKLATNHASDTAFIEKVVADGAFKLGDFEIVKTQRPVQTLKKVIRDEAECALVDNAQLAELPHIEGGAAVKPAWSSPMLPPMAVVAFSGVSAPQRAKFKASLNSLCAGNAKSSCDSVGIAALKAADETSYAKVIAKYPDP